jgi:hypothetical protein
MTLKEIEELAGHRKVSPWVVKLVGDAVAKEREACAKLLLSTDLGGLQAWPYMQQAIAEMLDGYAKVIRARGETK